MKTKQFLASPRTIGDITKDKEYEIIKVMKFDNSERQLAVILSDKGNKLMCLLNNCAHLNGDNWKLISKK